MAARPTPPPGLKGKELKLWYAEQAKESKRTAASTPRTGGQGYVVPQGRTGRGISPGMQARALYTAGSVLDGYSVDRQPMTNYLTPRVARRRRRPGLSFGVSPLKRPTGQDLLDAFGTGWPYAGPR